MIQQLQDENNRLRTRLKTQNEATSAFDRMHINVAQGSSSKAIVVELQRKLKLAVKDIQQLASEKQQLIELGNRLRSELQRCQCGKNMFGRTLHSSANIILHLTHSSKALLTARMRKHTRNLPIFQLQQQ